QADAEQLLEQGLTRVVVGVQEVREPALGEHHHLEELLRLHPQQQADLMTDVLVALRERLPARIGPAFQQRGRVNPAGAAAAPFRPVPGGGAGDAETPARHGELQADPWAGVRRGVVRAQVAHTAQPRDDAVEREPERVQQRGLAAAGLPAQQHQAAGAEPIQVELDLAGERAERGELQPVRAHQAPTPATRAAVRASASSARSASVAAVPRAKVTKSVAMSRSSRPRVSSVNVLEPAGSVRSGWCRSSSVRPNRARSAVIASTGRSWSVSTAATRSSACSPYSSRVSRSCSRPRRVVSRRNTGTGTGSTLARPAGPSSTSSDAF